MQKRSRKNSAMSRKKKIGIVIAVIILLILVSLIIYNLSLKNSAGKDLNSTTNITEDKSIITKIIEFFSGGGTQNGSSSTGTSSGDSGNGGGDSTSGDGTNIITGDTGNTTTKSSSCNPNEKDPCNGACSSEETCSVKDVGAVPGKIYMCSCEAKQTVTTCNYKDSDSNDIYTKGYCDDGKATIKYDSCSSDTILMEYFLDNNCSKGCKYALFNCAALGSTWKCQDGKCLNVTATQNVSRPPSTTEKNAVDSDAGMNSIYTKGYCDDFKASLKYDYCADANKVEEYYVDSDSPTVCAHQSYSCSHGCSNGACVDIGDNNCTAYCKTVKEGRTTTSKYNFGFCKAYNPYGALSQSQVCANNGMTFESGSSGCVSGYTCCCIYMAPA